MHCGGTDFEEVSLYTDLASFFFSFIWKTWAFVRARRARERGEHASEASEHLFALAVNKFPAVYFYHARSKDFEEKIEDLWGYEEVDKQNSGS